MQVGNLLITESAMTILQDLQLECARRGLPFFSTFRDSENNIMTRCPFHKGGVERKPSFGVDKHTMVSHCFSCGWAGGIDDVISQVLQHDADGGKFGRYWLAQRYLSISVDRRPRQVIAPARRLRRDAKEIIVAPFSEEELDRYRFYHDYMFQRGLTEEVINKFDVGYDIETDCITFPVYHIDGSPAFIARRSVKSKFFNYPQGVDKPVYAAETIIEKLSKVKGSKRNILITESIFNCLTAWKFGWPAVSLLGLGTKYQYEILRQLPVRGYVLGMDADEAGRAASEKLRKALPNKVIRQLDIPAGYDINDLQEQILELPIVL